MLLSQDRNVEKCLLKSSAGNVRVFLALVQFGSIISIFSGILVMKVLGSARDPVSAPGTVRAVNNLR